MLLNFFTEATTGSLKNILIMASILIPMMILLEIAREYKILNKVSVKCAPLMRFFGLSEEAAFPLLAGYVFGLAYGAGVIIESAKSGRLTWRDLLLINVHLSIFHSIFEDNALFIAIGADYKVIVVGRFLLATAVLFILSRSSYIKHRFPAVPAGKMGLGHKKVRAS